MKILIDAASDLDLLLQVVKVIPATQPFSVSLSADGAGHLTGTVDVPQVTPAEVPAAAAATA